MWELACLRWRWVSQQRHRLSGRNLRQASAHRVLHYYFFRQVLIKVLRASPVNAWVFAVALQSFIFCCCGVRVLASLAADRQVFMKALRSSPVLPLVLASALQVVIFCC